MTIVALRCFFSIMLISMLSVVGWACLQCPLWALPSEVSGHPWFLATLADVYWGFLVFWLWIAYLEKSWLSRGLWLIAVLASGNIATAVYMLIRLFRLPTTASIEDVLIRRDRA